jgi:hypothetical protein
MAENDLSFLKKAPFVDGVSAGKCSYDKLSCGTLKFQKKTAFGSMREKRIYFYREPLVYIIALASDGKDDVKEANKDLELLARSFSYIPIKGKLSENLKPSNYKSGSLYRSNFYGFSIDAPLNWRVSAFKPGLVQFKPLKKQRDDLAYVKVHIDKKIEGGLKSWVSGLQKYLKDTYSTYEYGLNAGNKSPEPDSVRLSADYKTSLFSSRWKKEALFVKKQHYVYELGFVSKGKKEDERNAGFDNFLKALKFD